MGINISCLVSIFQPGIDCAVRHGDEIRQLNNVGDVRKFSVPVVAHSSVGGIPRAAIGRGQIGLGRPWVLIVAISVGCYYIIISNALPRSKSATGRKAWSEGHEARVWSSRAYRRSRA